MRDNGRRSKARQMCRWGENRTLSSLWLPSGFVDLWGPFLCFTLLSTALMTDSIMLHPLQLCMRSPVLPVWDGSLRHMLGRQSKKFVIWLFGLPPDHYEEPRPVKPEHYQRTMYKFAAGEEDEAERVRPIMLANYNRSVGFLISDDSFGLQRGQLL